MADHMSNEHGHETGEKGNKGNDVQLPDADLDRDEDEPAWSPDNDLSKEDPPLGDVPANEGGPPKT